MRCAGRSVGRNFVFSNFNRFEKIVEVAGGSFANFFGGKSAQFAKFSSGFGYEGRLIPFAAIGYGRKKWAIGFDQHAVERNFEGSVTNLLSFGKSHIASE